MAVATERPKTDVLARDKHIGQLEIVRIDDLKLDTAYQRQPSNELVEKIARNYNPITAGAIVVSRRANGELFIVNGQHRTLAAQMAGQNEIVAQVINNLDREQEAELRLQGNVGLAERSIERFWAQVAAKHQESLNIVEIARKFETEINRTANAKVGLNSVSALEWLYRKDKGLTLTRVFEVIKEAWYTVNGTTATAPVMKGIAWFLDKHQGEFDRTRLIERMQAEGAEGLRRKAVSLRAGMGGSLWINYYRAIVEAYNVRLTEGSRLEYRSRGYSAGGNRAGDTFD